MKVLGWCQNSSRSFACQECQWHDGKPSWRVNTSVTLALAWQRGWAEANWEVKTVPAWQEVHGRLRWVALMLAENRMGERAAEWVSKTSDYNCLLRSSSPLGPGFTDEPISCLGTPTLHCSPILTLTSQLPAALNTPLGVSLLTFHYLYSAYIRLSPQPRSRLALPLWLPGANTRERELTLH